jgi:hypothetical protein
MDNRFSYMRKYLGFSQKDASNIFSTRLDTIKKWDSDKLLVPGPVLEELYDHIRFTNDMVAEFCDEREAEIQDGHTDEFYLRTFTVEDLAKRGLPPSLGWQDHVIGAIIGRLASIPVYGSDTLPEHYDPDYHWYEYWGLEPVKKPTEFFAIKDEALFANELAKAVEGDFWQVDFDPDENYYLIGFRTTSVSKVTRHIWIRAVRAGRGSELVERFNDEPLRYCDSFGEDAPYIEGPNKTKIPVGFASGHDDDTIDPHTLAETLFTALAASYPTEGAMRTACRDRYAALVGADEGYTADFLNDWDVKDTRFVSHNFIAALFFETQKQTGLTLHPEAMVELCSILAKSEPSIRNMDHEVVVIDMGEMVFTITLDLRDILSQSGDGRDFHTEAGKALDIIQASIGNDGLTRIEPFSTIEIEFTSNDAEE